MVSVTPRCKLKVVEPYISSALDYYPCCWIANEPHLSDLREWLADDFSQLSLLEQSLDAALHSRAMQRIESSWIEGTLEPCVKFCSAPFDQTGSNRRDKHISLSLNVHKIDEW
jgi:hypothetical protein